MADIISLKEYHDVARRTLMDECCVPDENILFSRQMSTNNGLCVIHLRTRGDDNIVASYPGYNRLFKHVFLKQPAFKKEVVQYYKQKGAQWVDIVALNRTDWKIFLFF